MDVNDAHFEVEVAKDFQSPLFTIWIDRFSKLIDIYIDDGWIIIRGFVG